MYSQYLNKNGRDMYIFIYLLLGGIYHISNNKHILSKLNLLEAKLKQLNKIFNIQREKRLILTNQLIGN